MNNHDLVVECVGDVVDNDDALSADTTFTELEGWDSVHALRLVVTLERAVGSPVDFERFMACTKVGELTELIDKTIGANA